MAALYGMRGCQPCRSWGTAEPSRRSSSPVASAPGCCRRPPPVPSNCSRAAGALSAAGGFGPRPLPLTPPRPKHLLGAGGVPFREPQASRLAKAGVAHVVPATSYGAELFEPVLGDGSRWGVRLEYVQEHEPL